MNKQWGETMAEEQKNEREKSPKSVFKERVKNWTNDERQHHLKLLEDKLERDEKQYHIQELGLQLFLENPYPLQPHYEYEREQRYVELKAELQKDITEEKLKELRDELEFTQWKVKYLKNKLGEKDE